MKKLIHMMAFASLSLTGMAQDLASGINPANMDTSVNPSENFFEYANGGWMKSHPLPAAYARYGSFEALIENNQKRINGLLSELQTKHFTEGSTEWKLAELYKLAMDSTRRAAEGVKPAMPWINKMQKAKTVADLFAIQLELAAIGDAEFYRTGVMADEKNSSQNILMAVQGGITLGQKEYYLDNDSATAAIREAYKKHITRMFQLFGFKQKEAEKKMGHILEIETALAKVSRSATELRNPEANYNKMTLKEFTAKYPHLKLKEVQLASGIKEKDMQELIVGQPEFMAGADKVVASLSADAYRAYMQWGIILSAANYLSEDIAQAHFDFFGTTLSGSKSMHPLWKRATSQVEGQMGEALGKMYTEKFFPASSKERMKTLVGNLQKALGERIKAQDWMSDSTKQNALEKLASFYVKIGYPDKWTDMTDLKIDPKKSYYENITECLRFWQAWDIEKHSGKPVDKDEWGMTPQTVNAYYNPTTNEICFPAGILQPPFFDPSADDAFNYGAIGVVIGHEMTHGFDDSGRKYDKTGNLHEWWTASDGANFTARTDRYADFFSQIKVLPDLQANGRLTLGENLADHGGLQVAWYAYKTATKDAPLADKDGFTADQRFFLAYAGVWAANITDEAIRSRTKSDPHSLGRWRVNGALPHIDMWYDAFNVKPGSKMYLPQEERLKLW